jgi:poly-gamma-glutamate capsule biosynthesis protein CapA/YwtB (metallophosphatase superfamily)
MSQRGESFGSFFPRWVAAAVIAVLPGCKPPPFVPAAQCSTFASNAPTTYNVTLSVVDDNGHPIAGAKLDTGQDAVVTTGASGTGTLSSLTGPRLVVVSASGTLSEPVPVGWGSAGATVSVHLWSTLGGKRWAMHNAGDSMFGRRYETPTSGTALIPESDPGPGARAVVASIARAFSLADFKTMNLETTVTNSNASYPGKRWILRTRPGALAALDQLDVSVVGLANNHQRDFLDPGVVDTTSALDGISIPHVGANVTDTEETPANLHAAGLSIGVLAFTEVDGTFVNDSYPTGCTGHPPAASELGDAGPTDASGDGANPFAFEAQLFDWGFMSKTFNVSTKSRCIGDAWQAFQAGEDNLSPIVSSTDDDQAWSSVSTTYPWMQDWVSRRGHGGAAPWNATSSPSAITFLKATSDIVIVQLHDGYQFQEPPGDTVQINARAAIDAGADIVICHHPHILQGFEFYKGKLIAYSLGNFVFDQDFLTSYGSGMLRSIWEGTTMLEARFIPSELNNYIPVITVDGGAVYGAERIWDLSNVGEVSMDDPNNAFTVRWFGTQLPKESVIPSMVLEHGTVRISPDPPKVTTLSIEAPPGVSLINFDGLVDSTLGLTGDQPIYVGRDVWGWGRFEDETVSPTILGATHWALPSNNCAQIVFSTDAASGRGMLQEERFSTDHYPIEVSTVSAIPTEAHREWKIVGKSTLPVDPDPSFSVRFESRTAGTASASLSIAFYTFNDANPTEDPTSAATTTITVPITPSDNWQVNNVAIPTSTLGANTLSNMVFLNFILNPPTSGDTATLDVDNVAFIEWRQASQETGRFARYGYVRNDGSTSVMLNAKVMSLGAQ